jgi:hypothetical protein
MARCRQRIVHPRQTCLDAACDASIWIAMRKSQWLVAGLLLVTAGLTGAATRRECVKECGAAIAACESSCDAFGVDARTCRLRMLRTCRHEGIAACAAATTTSTTSTTTTTFPPGCGLRGIGVCGGSCPSGFYCGERDGLFTDCECFVDPAWEIPCTGGSFPICGGTCPGSLVCIDQSTSITTLDGKCLCVPPS